MTDDVMARVGGRDVVEQLRSSGALDGLFERIDSGGAGDHWDRWPAPRFAQRVALERGLAAELTDHLGYERGESAPSARPNTRNGTTAKTVDSEVGPFEIEVPRDRAGSFTPRLVRKGQRRLDGLDSMIISLYAGGMTVRDIRHHLASTIGVDLSAGTIPEDHRRGVRRRPAMAAQAFGGVLPRDLPRARSASRSAPTTRSPTAPPTSPSEQPWTGC